MYLYLIILDKITSNTFAEFTEICFNACALLTLQYS